MPHHTTSFFEAEASSLLSFLTEKAATPLVSFTIVFFAFRYTISAQLGPKLLTSTCTPSIVVPINFLGFTCVLISLLLLCPLFLLPLFGLSQLLLVYLLLTGSLDLKPPYIRSFLSYAKLFSVFSGKLHSPPSASRFYLLDAYSPD